MKTIVAIANHGLKNHNYLNQLIDEYQSMPPGTSIIILSNIQKTFDKKNVEVLVGTPTSNPWSLPFAHRTLFLERINDYDLFIYSEDDTLLPWESLKAFIDSSSHLHHDEIAGFLRTEQSADGQLYYSTCHSHFRWIPTSVRQRGGLLWAKYSNEHSACYVATKEQILQGIKTGGFVMDPHEGRFDMLCSAATDIYTRCGFEKIICIDKISEFSLPHLPNKYIGEMGLPLEELQWQIDALRSVYAGKLPSAELIQPETLFPGAMGSKKYREEPDPIIDEMLMGSGNEVLVYGAGDGVFEKNIKDQGYNVTALPLNAVVGECCRKRGLHVLPINGFRNHLSNPTFDTVIIRDILHLADEPRLVIEDARSALRDGGKLIVRVPNFYDRRTLKSRWKHHRLRGCWTRKEIGAIPFTTASLKSYLRRSGFGKFEAKTSVAERFKPINRLCFGLLSQAFSPGIYIRAKKN